MGLQQAPNVTLEDSLGTAALVWKDIFVEQLGQSIDVNGFGLVSTSNGDILIQPNGTGKVQFTNYSFPSSDGSSNQILKTDGAGALTFQNESVSGLTLPFTGTDAATTAAPTFGLTNSTTFTGTGATSAYTFNLTGASSTGTLMFLSQDGDGKTLSMLNTGTGNSLFIDHDNAGGNTIVIDSESTATTIDIDTLGGGMVVVKSGGGSSNILYDAVAGTVTVGDFYRGVSTGTSSTSTIFHAQITNSGASGIGVHVENAGTGNTVFLDTDGDSISLNIDSESTTADVINLDAATSTGVIFDINAPALSSGIGIDISSAVLTSGHLIRIDSDASTYVGPGLMEIVMGLNSTGSALHIDILGAGDGLFIEHDDDGICINIDTTSTSGFGIDILHEGGGGILVTGDVTNAGVGLSINQDGNASSIVIDSEATTADALVIAALGSGRGLDLTHVGTGNAARITSSIGTGLVFVHSGTTIGMISATSTTLTSGIGTLLGASSSSFTGNVLKCQVNSSSATGNAIEIQNEGKGGSINFLAGKQSLLTPVPSTDEFFFLLTINQTVNVTCALGDILHWNGTQWVFADADAIGTADGLAVALESIASASSGRIAMVSAGGILTKTNYPTSATSGVVYLSTTATTGNTLTMTAPSGNLDVVIKVGFKRGANTIVFDNTAWVEVVV